MSAVDAGRKRVTLVEPVDANPLKKARIEAATDPDETEDEDEPETAEALALEAFRKEAIWREMRDYKRRAHRAQEIVAQLENDKREYQARLAVVDLTWNALVQEASLLLPSTSTTAPAQSDSSSVSDPQLTGEELKQALGQRSAATLELLQRLAALQPQQGGEAKLAQLQTQCHTLIQQSQEARESLRLLRAQHAETVEQLESTHNALLRAEKKLDRAQSLTVAKAEGRPAPSPGPSAGASTPTGAPSANGTPAPPGDVAAVAEGAAPAELVPANMLANAGEVDDLRQLAESRAGELEQLRQERVALKMELDGLKVRLADLPDEAVAASGPFQLLQSHTQHVQLELDAKKAELDKVAKEADELRVLGEQFRETTAREAAEQVDEVQKRLVAKEADLARIRAQREDYAAEARELKAREADKQKHVAEVKTLASSRQERITAYDSEVRRLKMQIAASKGQADAVELLATGGEEQVIVADLQSRLATSETLLRELGAQLQQYAAASGEPNAAAFAQSESDARKELVAARQALAKFEAQLGPEASSDVRELSEKLLAREAQLGELEAGVKAQEHSTNMLYGEIDRLSTAWATLDEQNASKVLQLAALEDKLARVVADKAKADNRYFATMRQKDALTAENATLAKLADKQQSVVLTEREAHRSLSAQLTAAEREIVARTDQVRAHETALNESRREQHQLSIRHEHHVKRIGELNTLLAARTAEAEHESGQRSRLAEQLAKADKELKQAKAAVAVNGATSAHANDPAEVKELKKYNQDLSKMLKCNTCAIRYKQVIISRCGHLFCKECIDDRLANRQRKCPSCGIQFGQADVAPIYF